MVKLLKSRWWNSRFSPLSSPPSLSFLCPPTLSLAVGPLNPASRSGAETEFGAFTLVTRRHRQVVERQTQVSEHHSG